MDAEEKILPLIGYKEVTVTHNDKTSQTVRVKQLPVRSMPDYLRAQDDEAALIALACDKKPEWSDTLTPESLENLVAEVEAVNKDFFQRWFERRKQRAERLMPGVFSQAAEKLQA